MTTDLCDQAPYYDPGELHTFIIDDGTRPSLAEICERFGGDLAPEGYLRTRNNDGTYDPFEPDEFFIEISKEDLDTPENREIFDRLVAYLRSIDRDGRERIQSTDSVAMFARDALAEQFPETWGSKGPDIDTGLMLAAAIAAGYPVRMSREYRDGEIPFTFPEPPHAHAVNIRLYQAACELFETAHRDANAKPP